MEVINKSITYFKNTKSPKVAGIGTIGSFLDEIKNGDWKDDITRLRGGDKSVKLDLPTIAFHGNFNQYRRNENFIDPTGIIIIDIDDVEDISTAKTEIAYDNSVLACFISPSGTGIKVLYYVEPSIVNKDSYKQIQKTLAPDYEFFGKIDYLSVTDCLIMSYDKDIYINPEVECDFSFQIKDFDKKIKSSLEERDKSKELWEDAEEFYETVLYDSILNITNNNYHFIQVSVLDMKKYGFTHEDHDLEFIINYSENAFKYSKENKSRFKGVVELAKKYPQQKWPYNTTGNSDYENEENLPVFGEEDYEDHKPKEEDEDDGFIDYDGLFEKTIEVAKQGDRIGLETSLTNFNDVFRFGGTGILTVTGIPSHGKTEFVDQIIIDLARLHDKTTIIAGFEQTPEEHIVKLSRKVMGVDYRHVSYNIDKNIDKVKKVYDFVVSRVKHIDTSRRGNLNKILKDIENKVVKERKEGRSIDYVVIDPFNMLSIKSKSGGHERIEEMLRMINQFSHRNKVLVLLVAHPFKMSKNEKTGEYDVPDFYSVKGSSAFYEMSYHGLVVYRAVNRVMVRIMKVKQTNLGVIGGETYFDYDKPSGRYIPIDENGNELAGDHFKKNWLEK